MTSVKSRTRINKHPKIAPSPQGNPFPVDVLSPKAVERIDGIERADDDSTWEGTDEVVQVEVKRPLKMVIPVRLPAEAWEHLRERARDLGIGPTTLARMWILERLKKPGDN